MVNVQLLRQEYIENLRTYLVTIHRHHFQHREHHQHHLYNHHHHHLPFIVIILFIIISIILIITVVGPRIHSRGGTGLCDLHTHTYTKTVLK